MVNTFTNKLSSVPKEILPAVSVGVLVVAVFLVLIFFVLCMVYMNAKSPHAVTNINKKPTEKEKKNLQEKPTKIRYEDLPIISGRCGEILALNGFLRAGPITKIFLKVLDIIKNSSYDIRWRYNLPFFMLLGASGSGKKTLLNSLSFERLSSDVTEINSMWRLFKNGAIFNVPKADDSENKKTFWSFLSELFIFIRPRRPLDGIIVTIPMDMLLSSVHNVEAHASETFEKVFTFQKEVNFRLPIYLIVTKTDLISGFAEFAHFLKDRTKQQMFGWSNPYTLNTIFSPLWVTEMFSAINKGIKSITVSYAKDKDIDTDLEKAILFESNFRTIETSLSLYLNAMFRAHSPEDGLLLRGVYFIGKHKKISLSSSILQPSALSPGNFTDVDIKENSIYNDNLCFVQDVFAEKIFKEHNLAHPIYPNTIDMSKKIFRNKLICASAIGVISIGWFLGNRRIGNKIQEHHNILSGIKTMLTHIKSTERNVSCPNDQALLNQQVRRLLHNIPVTGKYDFFSPFVVQSWFSGLYRNVINTMGLVFDSVIVRALYVDLNVNTRNMLTGTSSSDDGNNREPGDIFDITTFSSFRNLQRFGEQILFIQTQSSEYNTIRKLNDRKSVLDLMSNLFKDNFQITAAIASHTPNKKLMPPKFDLGRHQGDIESTLAELFNSFINEVFSGIVEKVLQNITEDIKRLEVSATGGGKEYSAADLAKLYQKIVLFVDIMKNKHFEWISGKQFAPSDAYIKLVNNIHASGVVSDVFLRDILKTTEARFYKFKEKIRNFKTKLTGNIVNDDLTQVSDGFLELQKELKILLDQPFICVSQPSTFTAIVPRDKMLLWNIRPLEELSDLIDKYEAFINTMPLDMRSEFFDMHKMIAKKSFTPMVRLILGKAQVFEDLPLGDSEALLEKANQKQAANIRNATVPIVKIARFFSEIYDENSLQECDFTSLIISQYMNFLEEIDSIFTGETLFFINEEFFERWTGEKTIQDLHLYDDAPAEDFLARQFSKIRFLAKDLAAPVVDILTMPHIINKIRDRAMLDKWEEIIKCVKDYTEKKPGNSLDALEKFLLNTMRNLEKGSLSECGNLHAIAMNTSDFFMEKRAEVARALLSRTEELLIDKVAEEYGMIQRFFNENLANKFPFGENDDEVTLEELETFVRLYELTVPNIINAIEADLEMYENNQRAIDFLDSMHDMMPLLRAWILHARNSDVQNQLFTFTFITRPPGATEQSTSALLEREVKVRGVTAEDGQSIVFNNDEAVEAAFTWVETSDQAPHNNNALPDNLMIDENVATFSYKGKWAMFRMIEKHKANKHTEFPDGILLEFEVPLLDQSGTGSNIVQSRIIMKVIPRAKNAAMISTVPWPVFPTSCPALIVNNEGF